MSNTTARRALSFLIVGAMVLAGLFVLVTAAPVASARAIESPATPTTGVTGSPRIAENPSTAAISAESRDVWKTKLDSGLKDAVDRGSTGLVDAIIYTQDMNPLTPLLNKFAVERLPEEFRGKDQRLSQRSLARAVGIVSTTVTIPTFAIKAFAKLPSVLGIETRMVPATADYTNLGLTSERESVTRFREQLQSPGSGPAPTDWSIVRSQHVVDSSGNYPMGFDGSGVNIAVQDWGADFGHPNLLGQWATDQIGDYPNLGLTSERESVTRFREQLQSPGSGPAPTDWSIVRSQHVVDSSGNYPMGFDGSGVNIAVQDWGADFGHPNLLGQWATD